jgi:trk system potassium uptake protein TrkA
MKVIIIGSGRMGSTLALELSKGKHDITVIDDHAEALNTLGRDFTGTKVVGVGFDKAVLEEAGIERADAVVVCTSKDTTNALIGRIAKNMYRVPQVITRLYDPRKAEIYNMLGLRTISTTDWGIKRTIELLNFNQLDTIMSFADGDVNVVKIEVPELMVGRVVDDFSEPLSSTVICLTRRNTGMIPTKGTVLERGDIVYVSVLNEFMDQFRERVGL